MVIVCKYALFGERGHIIPPQQSSSKRISESDLTVHSAPATPAKQSQQHTQKNVQAPVQFTKSAQYGAQLTANGELNMNLKKLKTPSLKLKDFAVGVTFATATAVSGAP